MPILPKPYPDEVIGSVIARGSLHSGLPMKALLHGIYGVRRSGASFLMASALSRLALLSGTPEDELLDGHTVFPYAVAFMSKDERDRLRSKVLRGLKRHECTGSLTKAVSHGVMRRRFCADCAREDTKRYGETYWHRAHLLPGVYVCAKHRQPLATMETVRRVVHLHEIQMPDSAALNMPLPMVALPVLVSIATTSIAAFARQAVAPWNKQFRAAALHAGYRLPSGDVACRTLAHNLHRFYGESLLNEAGCGFDPAARSPWPSLLVRPACEGLAATPKYILMDVFLRHSEDVDVTTAGRYRTPGPAPKDVSKLDLNTASRVSAFLSSRAHSKRRYSVRQLLELTKAWGRFRHDRQRFPATQRVIAALKLTNQADRQSGRRPPWRRRLGIDR